MVITKTLLLKYKYHSQLSMANALLNPPNKYIILLSRTGITPTRMAVRFISLNFWNGFRSYMHNCKIEQKTYILIVSQIYRFERYSTPSITFRSIPDIQNAKNCESCYGHIFYFFYFWYQGTGLGCLGLHIMPIHSKM